MSDVEEKKDNKTELEYDLFPGCTISNRLPFIEKSSRLVFEELGVKLYDQPFGCCPDPVGVQSSDKISWLTLGARNLSISESTGHPIVSLCNGCTETLVGVKNELKHDQHAQETVKIRLNNVGLDYRGEAETYHFVDVLHNDIGLEKIKEHVKKPLKGVKVAIHLGCHFSRPTSVLQYPNNEERKQYSARICEALGATVVDYAEKDLCCGYAASLANEDVSTNILYKKIKNIKETDEDVDAIIVNCPTCFLQMDNGQNLVNKKFKTKFKVPILYVTELMALAFGHSPDELGLKFHRNKPMEFLKKKGIIE